jgi:hypothetical protein
MKHRAHFTIIGRPIPGWVAVTLLLVMAAGWLSTIYVGANRDIIAFLCGAAFMWGCVNVKTASDKEA